MLPDDDELKEGLKKIMSEPAKKKKDWMEQRREDYSKPHGNEVE